MYYFLIAIHDCPAPWLLAQGTAMVTPCCYGDAVLQSMHVLHVYT